MKELHELLDLCLVKKLNIQFLPKINFIVVSQSNAEGDVFYQTTYYDGDLFNYESGYNIALENLIKKVKEYENKL